MGVGWWRKEMTTVGGALMVWYPSQGRDKMETQLIGEECDQY
jgi:hypothetical protein